MQKKILVCHTISSLHPSDGGPSRTVTQLTDALANLSYLNIKLLSQSQLGEPVIVSDNPLVSQSILTSPHATTLKLGIKMHQTLSKWSATDRPNIFHDHGVWTPINFLVASTANRWKIPLVLQPRGMLEPWAIKHKALKKRLAMLIYQNRNLMIARVLVATASAEYENLRALGLRHPIAVIPNGIQFISDVTDNQLQKNARKSIKTVLFLSRIHPKKGILNLVNAWSKIDHRGWRLQIAGPDEGGHLAEVLKEISRLRIQESVQYIGEVDNQAKNILYRNADLFVLPTFSENFGVVIAEALAHGLPVITTKSAPWSDLEKFSCGWWIDTGVEPLVKAFRIAMQLQDYELIAMGGRGRDYVSRYDWGQIAQQTGEVYKWILGHQSKPQSVHYY